jgi:hypothetical protein
VAESARPQPGTGPDATAVYALGSSHGASARLQRQADELAADSAAPVTTTTHHPVRHRRGAGLAPHLPAVQAGPRLDYPENPRP